MPTVEELEIAYRDQVSAGAQAATASLNKMADAMDRTGTSAETLDTKVTRTTKSATGWVNSLDNVTKSANALSAAQAKLVQAQDTLSKGVEAGTVTQDQASRAIANQEANIAALTKRHAEFVAAANGSTDANKKSGDAAKETGGLMVSLGNAFGVTKYEAQYAADNVHQLVDQLLSGGSAAKAFAMQLPSITGLLGGTGNVVKVVSGFLMGPGGLVVAAAAASAAVVGLGVHAEDQAAQLAVLSQQLRATRSDYDAVAASAQKAAQAASAQTGVSPNDAKAAVATFDSVSTVDGTNRTQLVALTQEAANLAAVLGTTVPDAAKQMAAAMADPERAAEDFAQKGLLGVTEGLAQQVKALQDSGDKLGAWGLLNDQVSAKVQGAAHDALTPYQQAVEDLHKAMAGPIQDGKDLATSLGTYVVKGATEAVTAVTGLVNTLKDVRNLKIDWNTGDVTAGAQAGGGSVADTISRVGASLGANQDVIALAQKIAPIESSTGQFNASGSVVTSSAGALGAMQVMPGSANGNDISTLTGNVTAAEQLLIHLYSKYSGNQILVAMAYNWGEGNVDKYLAGTISATSIPQETLDYTQKVSGGSAYSPTTAAAMQTSVGDTLRTTDSSFNGQVTAEAQAYSQVATALANLNKLHDDGKVSDADYGTQTAALTDRMKQHMAVLLDLRDPMQQLAHDQDQATQAAGAYSGAQLAMMTADREAEDAAHKMGDAHASAADKVDAEGRAQAALTNQFNVSIATIDRQTNGQNKLIAGYDGTSGSLDAYIDAEKAAEQVRATSSDDTAEQARQLAILTSHMDSARASATDLATAQGLLGKQDSLQTVNTQIALLGSNSDDAARALAALAEHQDLVRRYGNEAAVSASDMAQKEAALSDQVEVATLSYQRQQQALSDLSSGVSNIFSTLGDDISQAFTQGSGSAITFKGVLQGLETQAASLAIKLAVINPILNSLGLSSTHLSTLGDVSGALSGSTALSSGSGGVGGTSILGGLSSLGSVFSLGNVATSGSNLLASIGIGSGAISGTAGAVGSGLMSGGLDFGAAAGSAGAGSGFLGSLGSFAGAVAPFAAVAGIGIPLISSLFSGHPKNPYTLDTVSTAGGQLSIGSSYNQAEDDKYTAQLASDISSLNATFKLLGLTVSAGNGNAQGNLGIVGDGAGNAQGSIASYLDAIRFGGASGTFGQALNDNVAGGFSSNDLSSVSSFQTAITSLKTMADTVDQLHIVVSKFDADAGTVNISHLDTYVGDLGTALNKALDGTSQTASTLSATISTISANVDNIHALEAATTLGTSDFQTTVAGITSTYQAAIAQAQAYGLSTDALIAKQQELTDAQYTTARAGLESSNQDMKVRYLTATGDDEGAALLTHDLKADADYKALDASFQAVYGAAWQSADAYETDRTQLVATESAERLQIEKQYQDDATAAAQQAAAAQAQQLSSAQQSVGQVFSSLTSYVDGLATSGSSPLSAADQYKMANDNFASDYQAALGGSFTALQAIQGDASTLLSTSQTYNGSGTAYANDYDKVLAAIANLPSVSDALTASAMQDALQDQTATLAALLQQLIDAANKQLAETQQAALRKAA